MFVFYSGAPLQFILAHSVVPGSSIFHHFQSFSIIFHHFQPFSIIPFFIIFNHFSIIFHHFQPFSIMIHSMVPCHQSTRSINSINAIHPNIVPSIVPCSQIYQFNHCINQFNQINQFSQFNQCHQFNQCSQFNQCMEWVGGAANLTTKVMNSSFGSLPSCALFLTTDLRPAIRGIKF